MVKWARRKETNEMKATIASFAAVVVLCGQAIGQEPSPPSPAPDQRPEPPVMNRPAGPPPRMGPAAGREWWRDPELVEKLQVSDEQVRRIEKIAQDHQIQEIDLRATLEKQEVALRPLMEMDQPDESQVLAQIDKVAQARANLEKAQVQMILAVRRVLTAEQAKKLRELRSVPPFQTGPGFRRSRPPEGPGGPPSGGPPGQPQAPESP
jgi:Spy/CpxP family protein refolding chaperone